MEVLMEVLMFLGLIGCLILPIFVISSILAGWCLLLKRWGITDTWLPALGITTPLGLVFMVLCGTLETPTDVAVFMIFSTSLLPTLLLSRLMFDKWSNKAL